jgi:hypothetical protein
VITEAHGIPLAVSLTGGQRNDATQLMPLIAAIPPVRGRREDHALEQGVNIAGSTARVISQSHRGPAEYIDVRHHAALGQPVTEPAEGLFDARAIEEGRRFAHAASISSPRRWRL